MDDRPIQVLLIEDNPGDARLIGEMLSEARDASFDVEYFKQLSVGLERLSSGGIDVILLDLSLPDSQGFETFSQVYAEASEVPTVVLTGLDDEVIGVRAVREGAQDYLVKGEVDGNLLVRAIRYAIERKRAEEALRKARDELEMRVEERTAELSRANEALWVEIAERRQVEEALRESEEHLNDLFDNADNLIQSVSPDGRFLYVNRKWREVLGYTEPEVQELHLMDIVREDQQAHCMELFKRVLAGESFTNIETVFVTKDGHEVTVEGNVNSRFKEGRFISTRGLFRDITVQKRLEEELQKVEKLESLGILAGGIAHDFNNVLTAVLGNISLARMRADPGSRVFETLTKAERASVLAKDLTQQLLTFSRGGMPVKKTASIAELLRESTGFALRGSNVRCEFSLPDDLWPVELDGAQMNQVISNLVINADQAMPEGGMIRIRAENGIVDEEMGLPLKPGRYVKIFVEDEGIGIPQEHLSNIFDPYFTTKQKGSGLGLTTSYSIVRNHDGYITAESQMTVGTIFCVHLPASEKEIPAEKKEEEKLFVGKGKILIMDDEELVREVAGEMLESIGYEVEYAGDGAGVLEMYQRAGGSGEPFDAVIMDLTIPGGMGGQETLERLLEIDPEAKAIASSGYSSAPVMSDFARYGFQGTAAKPYNIEELSEVLHRVLADRL